MTESDEIVKGYDPVIMRKLLSFLGPYWKLAVCVLAALAVATAAELASPIVMQRAVDRYIIPRYARIPAEAEEPALGAVDEDPVIGGFRYIGEERLSAIPGNERERLLAAGILSPDDYYLFSAEGIEEQVAALAERYPGVIETGGGLGVTRLDSLALLAPAERKVVHRGAIKGLSGSAVSFFALLCCSLLFSFFQVYAAAYIGQRVMRDIRNRLMDHTLRQSLGFLQKRPVGSLVSRVTSDVETINEFFTSVSTALLKDLSLMVGVFVALFLLDRRLALIALCTIPPVIAATLVVRFKARDAYRNVQKWTSRINAYLSEHISGMSVVQAFRAEKRNEAEFDQVNTASSKGGSGR
jgi:ATP-binding cassette subfamily B protein